MKENKHREYFFTWNNYEEDDYEYVKSYIETETRYGLLCREIAPTTGTKHLHFYFYFDTQKAFNAMKKKFPKANIKAAKGSAQQNKVYISKTDKDFFEYGEPPMQGKRTDISEILTSVQSGETMRQIIPKARSLQSIKVAEVCMKYFEKKRDFKPTVYWYYGQTGTGKTRAAYEQFPDAYEKKSESRWWDGYDAHEDVIIDDFRSSHIDFVEMLKLLDRYPCKVEIKGGFRQFLAKNIVITAPVSPQEMYQFQTEDVKQLLRRIDVIKLFSPPVIENKDALEVSPVYKALRNLKKIKKVIDEEITKSSAKVVCENC